LLSDCKVEKSKRKSGLSDRRDADVSAAEDRRRRRRSTLGR
jgi:hypothetical protein